MRYGLRKIQALKQIVGLEKRNRYEQHREAVITANSDMDELPYRPTKPKRELTALSSSTLEEQKTPLAASLSQVDIHKIAIEQANELWETGNDTKAFNLLRQARLHHGASAELQYMYGLKAYEQGNLWAAREALHDTVELDATHLDALELFLKINRKLPAAEGSTTQAFTALANLLPHAKGFDAQAAAFLLPSVPTLEIADKKIRLLRYSEDLVAKHIGIIAFQSSEDWHNNAQGLSPEVMEARIIVTLMRGDYVLAFSLLANTPLECQPKRALRLAIHKEWRRKNYQVTRRLLNYYRKLAPEDKWSRQLLKDVVAANKYLTDRDLTAIGFPFPARATKRRYEADTTKVLYLLHNSLPFHSAGYATRTHGLLRGLRSHGWDVDGVTRLGYPYDMPKMESLGPVEPTVVVDDVPYHRLSTDKGLEMKKPIESYVARYSKALEAFATQSKPFVLHAASNHWNGLAAVTTARRLGIRSVYEVRGLWEVTRGSRQPDWMGGPAYQYMARMEADAAANADQVIAITEALRGELIARGVDDDKIIVVPNGVEAARFTPRISNENLVTELGLQGKTVIGYVGSILDYEGLGLLIDAAQSLRREREDFAILLVGDGAALEELRERVETECLTDVVIFTGRVPHNEVEDYYSVIDICPFPRLPLPVCEMVSPLKPFEAMAMEKAVVASNVDALSEIVRHGSNGLLFEKGNATSLTRNLRALLDDPILRRRLAEGGRRWVAQERDWSILAGRMGKVYTSLGGSA